MNEEGYAYVEGYVNVACLQDTDARMVFVRRVMVNDGGYRAAQLQEVGMLCSIGEFYGDELHDREQLRFEDRGNALCGPRVRRSDQGALRAPGGRGRRAWCTLQVLEEAGEILKRDKRMRESRHGWVVAASTLRLDLAPPGFIFVWFKREEIGLVAILFKMLCSNCNRWARPVS